MSSLCNYQHNIVHSQLQQVQSKPLFGPHEHGTVVKPDDSLQGMEGLNPHDS